MLYAQDFLKETIQLTTNPNLLKLNFERIERHPLVCTFVKCFNKSSVGGVQWPQYVVAPIGCHELPAGVSSVPSVFIKNEWIAS